MNHGTKGVYLGGCRCTICVTAVPHGTSNGYGGWQCRCEHCRRANRRRQEMYKLAVNRGVPMWGDVELVKEHLRRLLAEGNSKSALASALGWSNHAQVNHVLNAQRITYATQQRILNLNMANMSRDNLIPARGTMRRLRALARAGYPTNLVADLIGFNIATLQKIARGSQLRVRRWVADAVTTFYQQHHMRPGPNPRVADRAAAHGWHPPLAWDDNDFDDPKGQARARTRIKR